MTKEELEEFLEKYPECDDGVEYDDRGNLTGYTIHEVDGKLFALYFNIVHGNNIYNEKYVDGKGYIRGVYEDPVEVELEERIVYEYKKIISNEPKI